MPTARIHGASLRGAGAEAVTVEARFEPSQRRLVEVLLSGLPDPVIRESRARLLAALACERLSLPHGRYYVNLVPAALKKRGELLDLPLAMALLAAAGHAPVEQLSRCLFLGEVGIDGRLHDVPGGLAAAEVSLALGMERLIGPPRTALEAAHLPGSRAFGAESLGQALALALRADPGPALEPPEEPPRPVAGLELLDQVRGQALGKQALMVAAAGGHHLLFLGPPGTGKSSLARALPVLLPETELFERIEITRVRSATGTWPGCLVRERPFRAPHHTTSYAGLVGGGAPLVAGEVSLAHRGVLFLDELTEWRREVLEALRQPLEAGFIELARATERASLPANFRLVAAMNPCPCGYLGHRTRPCRCSQAMIARYRGRISGPLLDRIDLRVELGAPQVAQLTAAPNASGAASAGARAAVRGRLEAPIDEPPAIWILDRVRRAQGIARIRQGSLENAALDAAQLDRLAPLEGRALKLMTQAQDRRGLSARAVQSLRRVARTLADLDGREGITEEDLGLALELRQGAGEL